ncbi:MAG: hypothetical protein AAF567_19750 [Actinomycetota bacterium]
MSWNIAEFIEAQLRESFGFSAWSESERTGADGCFEHVVDEQHAVIVVIDGFGRGDGAGSVPSLTVSLSRRDINELLAELSLASDVGPWRHTVLEKTWRPFLDRTHPSWIGSRTTADEVAEYLDEWTPLLLAAANLPFIEGYMNEVDPQSGEVEYRSVRIANRMLWGWDAGDDALLEADRDRFAHGPEGHPLRIRVEAEYERRVAWIAAHPDGIERELTGR